MSSGIRLCSTEQMIWQQIKIKLKKKDLSGLWMRETERCLKKQKAQNDTKIPAMQKDFVKCSATEKQKHVCSLLKLVWDVMWGFNYKRMTGRPLKEQSSV